MALVTWTGGLSFGVEPIDNQHTVELADFLSNWLKNHIQSEDQSYRPRLNEHGVY
jgi:hemerythrin